jgi:hypothetical protein
LIDMRNDWEGKLSGNMSLQGAGMGALRLALLFGSAAVALALILAPLAERHAMSPVAPQTSMSPGIDRMTTGSVGYSGTYTERRSVLQPSPQSVCIIRDNGMRSGDC